MLQILYLRMEFTFTLNEIDAAARKFCDLSKDATVFAFRGEMGAGKTTFITAVCHSLGVKDVMGSPTFSIINEYSHEAGSIYHIDMYRLKDEDEAIQAGVEDVLYSGELCFVEWPDRAASIFPADTIWIELEVIDTNTRKLRQSGL